MYIDGLESVLKRSFNDSTLQVIDYEATNLLGAGENYCSVLIKLDVKIRRDMKDEIRHLVAKTACPKDKTLIDWPLVLKKELFMYSQIHPMYRELEKEAGIKENELISAWPTYIGYRNSLKNDDNFDEDSLLLLENIKIQGFYNGDRKKGLDIHHARKALESLARYHALGIVMKQRRPIFAEKAAEQAQVSVLDYAFVDRCYESVLNTIVTMPFLKKHLSVVKSSFERGTKGNLFTATPSEPWALISHGDFWVNNMLFHKDKSGNVDDFKFVDFQLYRYTSPLTDLVYFCISSVDATTLANHLRELIDLYYKNFIGTLERMHCDTSPFSRKSFESELKKQAIDQLPLSTTTLKLALFEFDNDDHDKCSIELSNVVFETRSCAIFEDKLKLLTKIYESMGWF